MLNRAPIYNASFQELYRIVTKHLSDKEQMSSLLTDIEKEMKEIDANVRPYSPVTLLQLIAKIPDKPGFHSAIRRSINKMIEPLKHSPVKKDSNMCMRLLFRSDTRDPRDIFLNGFSARCRPPNNIVVAPKPFMSDQTSVVSLSATLEATPYFPCRMDKHSWIYIVAVDKKQYFDLHSLSLSVVANDGLAFILPWLEFPKEINVFSILPQHVLCAFSAERMVKEVKNQNDTHVICESFKIVSHAIMNARAMEFLSSDALCKKQLTELIQKYNEKTGDEIDVARPNRKCPDKLKKTQARNAFFAMNRLEPLSEYSKTAARRARENVPFSKKHLLQNTSGLLFSSTQQICKQNSLFYAAIESGIFDARIEQESKEIENVRLAEREKFLARSPQSEDMLIHYYCEGEEKAPQINTSHTPNNF